jgi:hypothetical protein
LPSSVCILTAYDDRFADLGAISVPSMRRFADAHGYALRAVERNGCSRRGGWLKIEPIIEALSGGFDFVLWLDADTYVARADVDIRNVTHPDIDLHMAWHVPPQHEHGDLPHFNTGVMLIRASDWSRAFFARVWERGPLAHKWNDQATIHHLLGLDGALRMGENSDVMSRSPVSSLNVSWNSIPAVCAVDDPMIWHCAGIEMSARLDLMRRYTSAAVRASASSGPFGRNGG